jgi:hypothetical protein
MPTPEAPRTGLIELRIVVASTRPRRLGPVIADWVRNQAPLDVFAVEVIDLAELNLPLLDEVEMPSTGIYHHEHTLRWKGLVDARRRHRPGHPGVQRGLSGRPEERHRLPLRRVGGQADSALRLRP